MQSQPTQDRRQHPRRDASLVVSYRLKYPTAAYDITHTRNVSQGGMLLTTVTPFERGVRLTVRTRLSSRGWPRLVQGTAEAVESREIVENLLYETRLRFIHLDSPSVQVIGDFCAGPAALAAATDRPRVLG
ncbi:MAG: hypothetical protein QNJ82_12060 [Gammaproteobacteria bacterium]|nr:hypothetical protein [Gammaproteobacteria bacterium]